MVMTAEVPKGYKKTEVGIIPEDWQVKKIRDVAIYRRGSFPQPYNIPKWYDEQNGMPFVQVFDVDENMKLKPDTKQKISEAAKDKSVFVEKGSVVLTIQGSIGRIAITQYDSYVDRTLLIFRSFLVPMDKYYFIYGVYQLFQNEKQKAPGGTIKTITKEALSDFNIPIPSTKTEQTAIATALSDIDRLIAITEKLIVKKRNIKQGAMQELLTGKRRLPGFSGKWDAKKLGEIVGRITTGKLDANAMIENGEYRFYTCAKNYCFIDKYAFDAEALLVSGNGANVGYIHYYKGKFNAYQRTYVLYDFSEHILYIKLFMDRNLQERIRVEVNAGNTPYITMGTLTEMEIMIPPSKEEQAAIAQVLGDMGIEIEQLEQKLDKYKMIKQGMIQELLTGKTRLI